MIESLEVFAAKLSAFLWGPPLLILLVGTHLFLTVRLRLIQRYLLPALRITFSRSRDGEGDISHFAALTTALASTVGAGNILGVAVAIGAGGPGAIFWMWLTGVFGMATKFAEAILAVQYREKNANGQMSGGPMYVLKNGLGLGWLGVLFAVFTAIAAFGIGNMFQGKAVAEAVVGLLPQMDPTWVKAGVGFVMAAAVAAVVFGGIRSISNFCNFLVPFMVVAYVAACLIVIVMHLPELPAALGVIFKDAFSGAAVAGGGLGAVIQAGVRRGLFSNESGLGSAPIAAAAAKTANPVQQALVSMTGTFWDTVVVCALTGLALVVTGAHSSGLEGMAMTQYAFGTIPLIGKPLLSLGLITFVFSTMLGWSYYGEKAVEYLGGVAFIPAYRVLWVVVVYIGATIPSGLVIDFSDSANALMAIPNLISLLFLSGVVAKITNRDLANPKTFHV
ncbi:MAG: alanine/glycine:cation symporter family protein [Chthoniobacterales bacterium]